MSGSSWVVSFSLNRAACAQFDEQDILSEIRAALPGYQDDHSRVERRNQRFHPYMTELHRRASEQDIRLDRLCSETGCAAYSASGGGPTCLLSPVKATSQSKPINWSECRVNCALGKALRIPVSTAPGFGPLQRQL